MYTHMLRIYIYIYIYTHIITVGPCSCEVLSTNRATCDMFMAQAQGAHAGCCLTCRCFNRRVRSSRLNICNLFKSITQTL